MRDFINQIDLTQIIIFVIIPAIGSAFVWYRKRIAEWRKVWGEVFSGLRDIPELKHDVKGICYYVGPNGGGSMMDSVQRTERVVGLLTEQIDLVVQTMLAENDADEDIGRFQCTADGGYSHVSQLYARWIGVGKKELLGWNYLNYIHPDDVERVRRAWDACRTENRQFRSRHRMVSAGGKIFGVEAIATPIPDSGPAKRWIGSIRRLENERRKTDQPAE